MPNKDHHRNMPHENIVLHQRQSDLITKYAEEADVSRSRIVREMIDTAIRVGYSPGRFTINEMIRDAHGGKR